MSKQQKRMDKAAKSSKAAEAIGLAGPTGGAGALHDLFQKFDAPSKAGGVHGAGGVGLQLSDEEIALTLRKMSKKSVTTRLKASQDFLLMIPQKEEYQVIESLSAFAQHFAKSAVLDPEWRVRAALQGCLLAIVKKVKKEVAPYLKVLWGPWMCACFDPHEEVSRLGREALEATFPDLSKRKAAYRKFQGELLDFIKKNFKSTAKEMSEAFAGDGAQEPESEEKERYDRAVGGALLCIGATLASLGEPDVKGKGKEKPESPWVLAPWRFLATNFRPGVRRAAVRCIDSLLVYAAEEGRVDWGEGVGAEGGLPPKALSQAVLGILNDKSVIVADSAPFMVVSFLNFLRSLPSPSLPSSHSKHFWPRLLACLKAGGHSASGAVYKALPSILEGCDPLLEVEGEKEREREMREKAEECLQSIVEGFEEGMTPPYPFQNVIVECYIKVLTQMFDGKKEGAGQEEVEEEVTEKGVDLLFEILNLHLKNKLHASSGVLDFLKKYSFSKEFFEKVVLKIRKNLDDPSWDRQRLGLLVSAILKMEVEGENAQKKLLFDDFFAKSLRKRDRASISSLLRGADLSPAEILDILREVLQVEEWRGGGPSPVVDIFQSLAKSKEEGVRPLAEGMDWILSACPLPLVFEVEKETRLLEKIEGHEAYESLKSRLVARTVEEADQNLLRSAFGGMLSPCLLREVAGGILASLSGGAPGVGRLFEFSELLSLPTPPLSELQEVEEEVEVRLAQEALRGPTEDIKIKAFEKLEALRSFESLKLKEEIMAALEAPEVSSASWVSVAVRAGIEGEDLVTPQVEERLTWGAVRRLLEVEGGEGGHSLSSAFVLADRVLGLLSSPSSPFLVDGKISDLFSLPSTPLWLGLLFLSALRGRRASSMLSRAACSEIAGEMMEKWREEKGEGEGGLVEMWRLMLQDVAEFFTVEEAQKIIVDLSDSEGVAGDLEEIKVLEMLLKEFKKDFNREFLCNLQSVWLEKYKMNFNKAAESGGFGDCRDRRARSARVLHALGVRWAEAKRGLEVERGEEGEKEREEEEEVKEVRLPPWDVDLSDISADLESLSFEWAWQGRRLPGDALSLVPLSEATVELYALSDAPEGFLKRMEELQEKEKEAEEAQERLFESLKSDPLSTKNKLISSNRVSISQKWKVLGEALCSSSLSPGIWVPFGLLSLPLVSFAERWLIACEAWKEEDISEDLRLFLMAPSAHPRGCLLLWASLLKCGAAGLAFRKEGEKEEDFIGIKDAVGGGGEEEEKEEEEEEEEEEEDAESPRIAEDEAELEKQVSLSPILSFCFQELSEEISPSFRALVDEGNLETASHFFEDAPLLKEGEVEQWRRLCVFVLSGLLSEFPSKVAMWHGSKDLSKKQRAAGSFLVSQWVSPVLLQLASKKVSVMVSEGLPEKVDPEGDVLLKMRFSRSARQIVVGFSKDQLSTSLTLRFPPSWPLRAVEVDCPAVGGISVARTRHLRMMVRRAVSTGEISAAVKRWASDLCLAFEGVEDCTICYSVVHAESQSLPSKQCQTCKNKFHADCIFRWFRTSHKTTCPLCQSPF